jgi:hypothetical protein
MAKLTAKGRKALPAKEFAGPNKSYPIPDANHGRNALAMIGHAPASERPAIKAAVHKKFPGIK